jgi:hypothetical protein
MRKFLFSMSVIVLLALPRPSHATSGDNFDYFVAGAACMPQVTSSTPSMTRNYSQLSNNSGVAQTVQCPFQWWTDQANFYFNYVNVYLYSADSNHGHTACYFDTITAGEASSTSSTNTFSTSGYATLGWFQPLGSTYTTYISAGMNCSLGYNADAIQGMEFELFQQS